MAFLFGPLKNGGAFSPWWLENGGSAAANAKDSGSILIMDMGPCIGTIV